MIANGPHVLEHILVLPAPSSSLKTPPPHISYPPPHLHPPPLYLSPLVMAFSSPLVFLAATLTFTGIASAISATSSHASAPAVAGPANLTGILTKGGQYTTFLRLLRSTQVGEQIQSQLNNSFNGMTVFAPTDNAFNNLKAGTLNGLSSQDQGNLVLFHVLPRYYSLETFETASNPVATQASGLGGVFTVNVSSTANQVNVTTGVVETPVYNALYADFPLAVYSIDKVLLPSQLFGAKRQSSPPAVTPVESPSKEKPSKGAATDTAAAVKAPSNAASHPSAAAGPIAGSAVRGGVAAAVGFIVAASVL